MPELELEVADVLAPPPDELVVPLDELCAALITLERVKELLSGTTSTSGDGSKPISEAISSVREAIEALEMNDPDEPSPLVRGFVLGEP